jgi:hypothetical protein
MLSEANKEVRGKRIGSRGQAKEGMGRPERVDPNKHK